jgi:hypothetical protein
VTPPRKARHSLSVKVNVGPSGCFESRTSTRNVVEAASGEVLFQRLKVLGRIAEMR